MIDMSYYRCLLPRCDSNHIEFVAAAGYSGNLMKHCELHHDSVVDALGRLIEETPMAEAQFVCQQFVMGYRPPITTMDRLLRRDNSNIAAETLCLVWFLDANVAFSQFDNPLFKKLIELVGGRTVFPSSTTVVDVVLPLV